MKETYQKRCLRETHDRHVRETIYEMDLYKRLIKEKYERDLEKRPMRETYQKRCRRETHERHYERQFMRKTYLRDS